jgi:raffinose/stachyose/melibiose transport system substrate-binding protein
MNKNVKHWSFVLALVLVLGLAGCAPRKAAPAQSSTGAEKVTVTLWKWIPVEGLQSDQVTAKWNEVHPDINLNMVHIGESEALFQKLAAAMQAGEGPSVLPLQPGARANQYKEFCEPLAPLARARWGANWEDKFLDVALEQCRFSGPEYTILPGGMTATPVIMYNATVFQKYGLNTPQTMEDVYNAIEVLKADPMIIPGIGIGAKEGWTCRDVFMGIVNQIAPGKVYDALEGKISFTEPEFVEALAIWKNLFDTGFFAAGSLGVSLYPDIGDSFIRAGSDGMRYYVMQNCGTWHGSQLTKVSYETDLADGIRPEGLHLGAFTLPAVKPGADKNMVSTVDVAWGLNNSKPEAEKAAAFEFIAFMSAEEGQAVWSNTLQVLPCAKGVDLSPAINDLNGDTEREALNTFQHYVENSVGAREIRYSEIANVMNEVLPSVAGGLMTPAAAAERLQASSASVRR